MTELFHRNRLAARRARGRSSSMAGAARARDPVRGVRHPAVRYARHQGAGPGRLGPAASERASRACSGRGGARERVAGIGISGQQHGFVPLDADGRGHPPGEALVRHVHRRRVRRDDREARRPRPRDRALGQRDSCPASRRPKILWLKKHEPENFARLATVLLPHDYLNFWLTGATRMEYGDASGTALLDVRKREVVAEAAGGDRPRARRQAAAARRLARAGRRAAARELARQLGLGDGVVVRGRRRQHDGRHRHRQSRAPASSPPASAPAARSTPARRSRSWIRRARSRRSATRPTAGCRCSAP